MKIIRNKFFVITPAVLVLGSGLLWAHGDMTKVAPHQAKVLFENDRIRVLETRNKPGETIPLHSHPPRFVYFMNPLSEKITYEGKKPKVYHWKAGDVTFDEAVSLSVENVGASAGRNIVVELKQKQ